MPKGKKKKEKEPIDKFTEMEDEKLIEFINKTNQQIQDIKVKRNFVQQERDMITSFYEIKTRRAKIKRSNRKRRNCNGPIKQRASK